MLTQARWARSACSWRRISALKSPTAASLRLKNFRLISLGQFLLIQRRAPGVLMHFLEQKGVKGDLACFLLHSLHFFALTVTSENIRTKMSATAEKNLMLKIF